MKPLPINPNVVSPIITLEIRTISANTAGAKDVAQIARNSQVASSAIRLIGKVAGSDNTEPR
ncbi:MAG TPA: hypothetical protein VIS99_17430 [Terrimicrobiaceae bacterium]